MVEKKYDMIMVLEDDIHFVPFFKERLQRLLVEISTVEWDFVWVLFYHAFVRDLTTTQLKKHCIDNSASNRRIRIDPNKKLYVQINRVLAGVSR